MSGPSTFRLVAEYLRHALAHPPGHPCLSCQFCPTLPVTEPPECGETQLLHPGLFPEPFLRRATELINKIHSMALSGDPEAAKFLLDLAKLGSPPPAHGPAIALPLPDNGDQDAVVRRVG